jgi:hypothetical protein
MPHGYRTNLATGHTLAVLGGANSVDKYLRTRRTWWPEESITASDLEQLGTSHADILVGHDAPLNVPSLDRYLDSTSSSIPFDMLEYGDHGRAMFYKGFTQVRPQLSISGHYHHPIDQIVGFGNGDNGFASRVVVLDQIRARDTASVALLAVRDLKLRFFSSAGDEVPVVPQIYELRPDDFGRWLVTTRTSSYVFNLDDSTVESLAGADVSNSVPAHQPMRLRRLDLCKIGQPGRWTLQAFGSSLDPDLSRHISSIVRTIDPLPAK